MKKAFFVALNDNQEPLPKERIKEGLRDEVIMADRIRRMSGVYEGWTR